MKYKFVIKDIATSRKFKSIKCFERVEEAQEAGSSVMRKSAVIGEVTVVPYF